MLSARPRNVTIAPHSTIDNSMSDDKIEMHDSMGSVAVPADALYQAQTQRALDNFKISSLRLPAALIRALARIKQGCAEVNHDLGKLDRKRAEAISAAAAINHCRSACRSICHRRVSNRLRHQQQHEPERGNRDTCLERRACRASQRSRQHGAELQRRVSVVDSHGRGLRSARTAAAGTANPGRARCTGAANSTNTASRPGAPT